MGGLEGRIVDCFNWKTVCLTKIIKQLDEQKSPFYLKLKNQISLKNISFKIKTIYNKYKYNSNQFIRTKLVNIFKPILPRKKCNSKNY